MRIHFGEFVLDRDTRQLVRGDQELHLGPKAFDFLDFLITQKPRVVSRARIRDRLWPGTFISESTLATVVNEVRAALGDDPKQAPLHPDRPGPRLRVLQGETSAARVGRSAVTSPGRLVPPRPGGPRGRRCTKARTSSGRVEDGVLWLDAPTVSRRHARIVVAGDSAVLEDLGSKNGTLPQGREAVGAGRALGRGRDLAGAGGRDVPGPGGRRPDPHGQVTAHTAPRDSG